MEAFLTQYPSFQNVIIYDFRKGWGGIGDYLKYFIVYLTWCMSSGKQFYCKNNNLLIQKYIPLKHPQLLVSDADIERLNEQTEMKIMIVNPSCLWRLGDNIYDGIDGQVNVNDIFTFHERVINHVPEIIQDLPDSYIGIHLRLGDKHLETDKKYVLIKDDSRDFSIKRIHDTIEKLEDENVVFLCDNQEFKNNLKDKYEQIITTQANIGHTSLMNTTDDQILDAVTEFYILSRSSQIYCGSTSGFSIMAAKFNNIKYTELHADSCESTTGT